MRFRFLYDIHVISDQTIFKELEKIIEKKIKAVDLQDFESGSSYRAKEWEIVLSAANLEHFRTMFKASGQYNESIRFYKMLVHSNSNAL
jgi:hypothetical protein